MSEQKKREPAITEYTGIQIFEESCGQIIRVCDPAEFGIVPREPASAPEKPVLPVPKGKVWSANQPQGPIVITEESIGKPVRVVDIAEINAIVKKQFNLG